MHRLTFTLLVLFTIALQSTAVQAQGTQARYPLLELFTNTRCPICASQDPGFVSRLANYEGEYHMVSFYPGRPYTDCFFYQANTSENDIRREFYQQVNSTPDVAINGVDFKSPNGVNTGVLDDITDETTWLSVVVSETEGNDREVSITLNNDGGGELETGKLFAVIAEREVMYNAPNGIDLHHSVFRKFLTSTDGQDVNVSFASTELSFTYTVDQDWDAEEVYIVAWLINPETMEVINSGTKYDEVVASVSRLNEVPVEIYPNPANDHVYVQAPEAGNGILKVYDASGRQFHQTTVQSAETVRISVGDWTPGIYVAEITTEDHVARGRVVVGSL